MNSKTVSTVKGINCVYLPAVNLLESANWYMNNFDLKLLNEIDDHSTQAQLRISSEQSLFLIKTRKKTTVTYEEIDGNEQCILTLEVNEIRELHEKLLSNSVEVADVEDNNECGLSFYVKDPNGNKIDIWGGWA